jgi:PhzF family phenazine biosynthesis protein
MTAEILRYTAFPAGDPGGNPAGVVLDAHGMTDEEMLAVAAEVGFSETAFLFPSAWTGELTEGVSEARVRYFSPRAEVPFCGHATIATAVAHAERHGAGRDDEQGAHAGQPCERTRGRHTDDQTSRTPLTIVEKRIT